MSMRIPSPVSDPNQVMTENMMSLPFPSPPRFHPFALSWVSYHTKAEKAEAKTKRYGEETLTVVLE
jgi:hypothetical protein